MTRYLIDNQHFLLELAQGPFDSLSANQKRDLKQFIMEVGLRGRGDGDAEDADEVNAGVTHLPHRMTQVRLPVTGPKRFALIEVVLGDPGDPARKLMLVQVKDKFVTKLAVRFGLSETAVGNAMTFTALGDDLESSRLGALAYLAANAAMWGEEAV